jgi:hypothetical protein
MNETDIGLDLIFAQLILGCFLVYFAIGLTKTIFFKNYSSPKIKSGYNILDFPVFPVVPNNYRRLEMELYVRFDASASDVVGDPNEVVKYQISWFAEYQGDMINRGTTEVLADHSASYEAKAPTFFDSLDPGVAVRATIVAVDIDGDVSEAHTIDGVVEENPKPAPPSGGEFFTVY